MNDKDKEEFDKWWDSNHYSSSCYYWSKTSLIGDELYSTWQAACKYKQKKIDSIDCYIERDEKIKKLQAENSKLRDCVEFYADRKKWSAVYEGIHKYKTLYKVHRTGSKRARQVLKELENK